MVKQVVKVREAWFKSRRVWGTIFATASSGLILFAKIPYVNELSALFGLIAASLGVTSFIKPK